MRKSWSVACLVGLLTLGAGRPAGAATLVRLDVDELIAGSELIFEGRVLALRASGDRAGTPRRCVRFAVLEVIKGELPQPRLELCFAGGEAGGLRLVVPGLVLPQPGERGVYFVASLSRRYWNPLHGWDQGHFVIEPEELGGADVVKTVGRLPVVGLERPGRSARRELSNGVARGVRLGVPGDRRRPLGPRDFKRRLRELLRESRP